MYYLWHTDTACDYSLNVALTCVQCLQVCASVGSPFTAKRDASLTVRYGMPPRACGQDRLWVIQSVKSSVCRRSVLACRNHSAGVCGRAVGGAAGRWGFLESPCADRRHADCSSHTSTCSSLSLCFHSDRVSISCFQAPGAPQRRESNPPFSTASKYLQLKKRLSRCVQMMLCFYDTVPDKTLCEPSTRWRCH